MERVQWIQSSMGIAMPPTNHAAYPGQHRNHR